MITINTTSALSKIWQINQKPYELIESIKQKHNLSYLTSTVIANRDILFEDVETFFDNSLKKNWISAKSLPDIESGILLIKKAISEKQKIGILGDYDVDGICSSVLWVEFFKFFSIETVTWIPNRDDEYGPSKKAKDFFENEKIDLLLTLDCGTNSHEFFENYKKNALIIDHHTSATCVNQIVINPNKPDVHIENHDLKDLCAAGVSILVISYALKMLDLENGKIHQFIKKNMDLVALATVCDVMKLTPINKAFIKSGLEELSAQKRAGTRSLIQSSNLRLPLIAQDIGFVLGPKINAAGRIESSKLAFELLTTNDQSLAIELSDKLNKINNYRKSIQEIAYKEALEQAILLENEKIICIANENWSPGIIGIIAAMIQNQLNKPTIIGNIKNNTIKASARSQNINIGNLIQQAAHEEIIQSGGGHFHAGGLTCEKKQWEVFSKWANEKLKDQIITKPILTIDAVIGLKQIEYDYKKLAPFGNGNKEVKVLINNLNIKSTSKMEKCLKVILEEDFQQHFFFIQNKKTKLIDFINNAHENNFKINIVLSLGEKGFHNIEDLNIS